MNRYIAAKVELKRINPDDWAQHIPVVVESTHPEYTMGKDLTPGLVSCALTDGYTVVLFPANINASNCEHPEGFVRGGGTLGGYRMYYCKTCHSGRGVIIDKVVTIAADNLPASFKWDYIDREGY